MIKTRNKNSSLPPRPWPEGHAGPHTVGTTRLRIAGGPTHSRAIVTRLWYPADDATTWWTRARNWFARLRHPTWAPARHGAPMLKVLKKAPAIVYVPGTDHPNDNTYMLANLASHGFIVVAIDGAFRKDKGGEPAYTHDSAESELFNYRRMRIARGVRTASRFLDALQYRKLEGRRNSYTDKIDPHRVGIVGYALGGLVAAQSMFTGRFIAAANLVGDAAEQEGILTHPYLMMLSDFANKGYGAAYRIARRQASQPSSHVIEVVGSVDEDFCDSRANVSRALPRRREPSSGRLRAIIDSYTVAFFDTYLRGASNPLMCVRHSPYAEVHFVTMPGAHIGNAR